MCGNPGDIEVIHQPTALQTNGSEFPRQGQVAFGVRVRDALGVPVHAVGSSPAMGDVSVRLSHDPGCPAHCSTLTGTTNRSIGERGVVVFDDLMVVPTAPTPVRYVYEIQEISLRTAITIAPSSSFQLSLDIGRGQKLATTPISAHAIATQADESMTASQIGLSIQSKLQALPTVGMVDVHKEQHRNDAGWSWLVTFFSATPMPLMRVERHLNRVNGAIIEVHRLQAGQSFAFEIEYTSQSTGRITTTTRHFQI